VDSLLEQVLISSRDPESPPKEYYLVAGGMLRDMTIYDFDLARFVLNEEVEKVTPSASRFLIRWLVKLERLIPR
jgi:myo-inositol 2-dehydrogenase/D-chiro-inositol 1-dehydrogenase